MMLLVESILLKKFKNSKKTIKIRRVIKFVFINEPFFVDKNFLMGSSVESQPI